MSNQNEALVRPVTGNSLEEIVTLGKLFKASGFFKDLRDEAQAVTKILYGRELGFTPVVSIQGIHIIEGKPTLSSNLMATLVKRSGRYDYQVVESTNEKCAIRFLEEGRDLGVSEFNLDDAKRAGVLRPGSGWTKYPKAMLFARALSQGVRMFCPDVTQCPAYTPEELGAVAVIEEQSIEAEFSTEAGEADYKG